MKEEKPDLIIDASKGILGRIASYAAKQALLGKKIAIVNCDEALLTGNSRSIIKEYDLIRKKGGSSLKGPFFPKHTERIMKRTVRGMLNYHQKRGLDAFNRVICYPGLPKEYEASKKESRVRDIRSKTIKLSDLSKEI